MRSALERVCKRALITAGVVLITPAVVILALRWVEPPFTAYMLRTAWTVPAENGASIHYHWVDIEAMADCMPLAVVASEDQTFAYHNGFAWGAVQGAMADNLAGTADGIRGASTISQQTVKNLFLWPARSYVRKAIEGYLTLWMELLWSKRRILEMYLNIAQFDDRVFGVGAAARHIFGTSAGRLSPRQCAALAAVLPAPTEFSARSPSPYIRQRIDWIREQMRNLGSRYLATLLAAG